MSEYEDGKNMSEYGSGEYEWIWRAENMSEYVGGETMSE